MVFVLPQSLLPTNNNFDLWLHRETKTAETTESSSCVKKQLATDNLSTWLSTRYAANQTKKSNTEVQSNDLLEENLDMWLSQKRRKMSEQHSEKDSDMSEMSDDGEDLTMWLHPDLPAAKGRKRSATSVALDSLSSMTLDPEVPALRLCPALSNWEANAQLPLNSWLEQTTLQDNSGMSASEAAVADCDNRLLMGEWLSVSAVTGESKSGFRFPRDSDPIQAWLVQEPKTALEDALEEMRVAEEGEDMVGSWIDQNRLHQQASQEENEDESLNQWLLVEPRQSKASSSTTDDESSIVVLDQEFEPEEVDNKSVASWKFW